MFVPIKALENERPLKSVVDILEALDHHVLPKYKDEVTRNVAFTKTECFGVLMSFYQAGLLNPALTPFEVESAVKTFMDERLFVLPEQFNKAQVAHSYQPSVWFNYTLKQQFVDLKNLYVDLFMRIATVVYVTYRLMLTNVMRASKVTFYKLGILK